jgi:hypothetical protein
MPPLDCTATRAAAFHARLLTPTQYNNAVGELVKAGGDPSKDFGGASGQLDDLSVERRANAAAAVAQQAAATLAQWSPCVPPQVAAATCEQQIIDRIAPRAYRRPLSASERQELQTLFDAGVTEKDFATGVEWFLTGLFQSPDFSYQFALPASGEKPGDVRPLAPYEIASRLSFFMWDSLPDDALLAAAGAGNLGDGAGLASELSRMATDARFMRGVSGFYQTWLRLDGFHDAARDDVAFTTAVVNSLETSLVMSATQLYSSPSPNVSGLFSGTSYYMDASLRSFYGLSGNGAGFVATDMPGEGRHGILTHPALMALFARPAETNPISRGLYIRRVILCKDMAPPPPGVPIPPLPAVAPGLSTRDRLDQHAKTPFCASCHNLFDPPGYAFENFDQVGRHRTNDNGKPIDTSGTMNDSGDVNGAFAKGEDLLAKLGESLDVKACFAQRYFEYAVARNAATEDACSLDGLKKEFVPSGDLRQLVLSIGKSDAFRYRLSEGGP